MPNTAEQTLHILLLDDHALFRESVARLLSIEPGFDVVAHCGTIEEALQVLRRKSIDLVLLDFDLGERDGPRIPPIGQGTGIPWKDSPCDRRCGCWSSVGTDPLRHFRSLSQTRFRRLAGTGNPRRDRWQSLAGPGATADGNDNRSCHPAARRNSTIRRTRAAGALIFVFDGLANKEIAARIGVSEGSVKSTLQQLFSKTGVRTRSQLVRIVLEQYREQI